MRKSLLALIISILLLALCLTAYHAWLSPNRNEGTIVVTDALGRTVKIKTPINKVIITGKSAWPIITVAYMFPNAKNVLINLSASINVPLFQKIDPNIKSKTVQTTELSAEAIAGAKPDVVILKSTMTMKELGDQLEGLDIKVVYVDFENLENYIRDLKVLGKIFMDEKRGEKLARYYNETYNFITSRTKTLAINEREKVLFLYYSTKGGIITFNVPGSGWLQTFMIEAAGGSSLSKELSGAGWNPVNFEQIAKWNPDVIFLVTYSKSPTSSDLKRQLLENATWSSISAVQSGRVYAVPDDCNVGALGSWDCPGSRWIIGLEWMAKKINPELFSSDLDIIAETRKFYMEMYGLSQSDAEAIINQITGDFP
ncbi:MAG: ABC transporter substrate-binding protein [Candidatus Bathyarchaeia archaeon]